MPRGSSSSELKEKRKKIDKNNKLTKTDLLIRKLRKVNRRGKVVGQKNKMSTFKAQSSYDIAKQQSGSKTGMSNLGAGYKKQEEKLSKKATESSAKINKARYPKMGTYKNAKGESVADEKKKTTGTAKKYGSAPKGYIKSGTKFVSLKTAKGKQLAKLAERKRKLKEKRFGK